MEEKQTEEKKNRFAELRKQRRLAEQKKQQGMSAKKKAAIACGAGYLLARRMGRMENALSDESGGL